MFSGIPVGRALDALTVVDNTTFLFELVFDHTFLKEANDPAFDLRRASFSAAFIILTRPIVVVFGTFFTPCV